MVFWIEGSWSLWAVVDSESLSGLSLQEIRSTLAGNPHIGIGRQANLEQRRRRKVEAQLITPNRSGTLTL